MQKLPKHIAIVMDGNGRWAKKRNLPRSAGHRAGGEAARKIIKNCVEKGIEVLTLFAFGIENWNRPAAEIKYLMNLLLKNLQKSRELNEQNIKFRIIGDYTKFSDKLREKVLQSQSLTANNTGLQLNAAINYSGKWDIAAAAKKLAQKVESGEWSANEIMAEHLQAKLCLHDLPDPDLFIRTSGEKRLSNFMLWQLAYTELYFTDTLWPDFGKEELEQALTEYAKRERRFGGIAIAD